MKTKMKTNTQASFGAGLPVRAAVRVGSWIIDKDDYVDSFLDEHWDCQGVMGSAECQYFASEWKKECVDECFNVEPNCAQKCDEWNAYLFQVLG